MSQNNEGEGARIWIIPDGYLPPLSDEDRRKEEGYWSHEAICIVNTADKEAKCTLQIFFEDREPIKDIQFVVGPERSLHLRLDKPEMMGGKEIPEGVPYSLKVISNIKVVVQHSRLDTTQEKLALFTTMGYPIS